MKDDGQAGSRLVPSFLLAHHPSRIAAACFRSYEVIMALNDDADPWDEARPV
jgi:hypothetical protein